MNKKQEIEVELMLNGFKQNTTFETTYDRDNIRVYFDDLDVIVTRFDNMKSQCVEWQNRLDGNMPTHVIINVILAMI